MNPVTENIIREINDEIASLDPTYKREVITLDPEGNEVRARQVLDETVTVVPLRLWRRIEQGLPVDRVLLEKLREEQDRRRDTQRQAAEQLMAAESTLREVATYAKAQEMRSELYAEQLRAAGLLEEEEAPDTP